METRSKLIILSGISGITSIGLALVLGGCATDQPEVSSASINPSVTITETEPGPTTTLDNTVTETETITKYVHADTTVDTPGPLPGATPAPAPTSPAPEGFVWEEVGPHDSERACTGEQRGSRDETTACFEKEAGWFFHALLPEP
ncbi:hypothetical protein [Corynebacterium sp.]|uniref:hypothetical protein n=1 Tax=Corynebacterium sp. TaxID=1720 RepID=UPI003736247D